MRVVSTAPQGRISRIVDSGGKPIFQRDENSEIRLREISEIFARQDNASGSSGGFKNVWVYSIITSIASKISQTPSAWWTPNKNATGISFKSDNWTPIFNTPFESLMEQPNEWQDKQRFIEQWVTFLLGCGNVWIYPIDGGRSVPTGLLLFSNKEVAPVRQQAGMPPIAWCIKTGKIDPNTGKDTITVPLDAMIHTMMPNEYDQYMGMPPWMAALKQLNADNARVVFDEYFFRNNATPDAVLTYKPGPLNEDNRRLIEEAWNDSYAGAEKAGNIAVIGGDFDLKLLGSNHSQSQFLESRDFTRQEIASCYSYPVQMLNSSKDSGISKDQLSVARTLLWENAVIPIAVKFENAVSKVSKNYKTNGKVRFFFDYDGLPVMIDYLKTKTAVMRELIESGVTINEAISKLDLGFSQVENGNTPLVSTRLQTLEEAVIPKWEEKPKELELLNKVEESGDESDDNDKDDESPEESRMTPEQLYLSRVNSVEPVVDHLAHHMKRMLFDIRNECFSALDSDNPFSLEKFRTRWKKRILHAGVLAAYVGDAYAKGRTVTLSRESVNTFIENLRNNENRCINREEAVIVDLEKQADNSFAVITDVWNNLRNCPEGEREEMVNRILDNLVRKAKEIAARQTLWARNAGEFYASKKTLTFKRSRGCPHVGRYPGDPQASIGRILNCLCVCVSESEVKYA